MRDGWAARPWLRRPSCSVCLRPRRKVRDPAPPRIASLSRPGPRAAEPNPPGRKPRIGLPCKIRAGRKPMLRSARRTVATQEPHPVPAIPLPVIQAATTQAEPIQIKVIQGRRIWGPVIPVPLIRGMRQVKALRGTWATGLTSTAICPLRSRSGRCAAIQVSGGCHPVTSSGWFSNYIRSISCRSNNGSAARPAPR